MKKFDFIYFQTWKEFFDAYMCEENLTLNDFKQLCSSCDPLFDELNDCPTYKELFELYNSNNEIRMSYDEDDGINENDFIIVIYDGEKRYYCPVIPPECGYDYFGGKAFFVK